MPSNSDRSRPLLLLALSGLCLVWAAWSYAHGGLIATLVAPAHDQAASIDRLREYLAGWGPLAPVVYVLAVTLEVVVAPIPGTLLYAPGGAVFGGFMGGTLSLAGNVIGATIACLVARTFGERISARMDASSIGPLMERLRAKSLWLVVLLRANPLTSSDMVSYAAGLARVPVWHVTVGTLGMAPLCYAQSYLAEQIFRWIPASGWIVALMGAAYLAVVLLIMFRGLRRAPSRQQETDADDQADAPGDRR